MNEARDPPASHTVRPSISNDAIAVMSYENNKKSLVIAYLLWFFFGWIGGHRFYLGKNGTAITMLLISVISFPLIFVVVGFFGYAVVGIWAIVDAFLIPGIVTEKNNFLINAMRR